MEVTYTLLETTLAMIDGLHYLPNFKKFGINSAALPLLTDEDLIIIGVDDEQVRERLIKQCINLPLLSDSRLNTTVNEKYLMTVLNEIDHHLLMLDASLTYALKRKDTQRYDIQLSHASSCLMVCADSFEKAFNKFRRQFPSNMHQSNGKWKFALLSVISAAATVFVFKKYISLLN